MHSKETKRRSPFKALDNGRYRELRGRRNKYVNMIIRPDLNMPDCKAFFVCDVIQQLYQICFNAVIENFVSLFYFPYDMTVQIVNADSAMCKTFIVPFHTYVIQYASVRANSSRF